jgi:hypothetical protein
MVPPRFKSTRPPWVWMPPKKPSGAPRSLSWSARMARNRRDDRAVSTAWARSASARAKSPCGGGEEELVVGAAGVS